MVESRRARGWRRCGECGRSVPVSEHVGSCDHQSPTKRFSARGEEITLLECELVINAIVSRPENIHELWILIAREIGIEKLAIVFDELGGEKVHIPTRAQFFATLYRPYRNREIRDMRNETGKSLRAIARALGTTHQTVVRAMADDPEDDV